MYVTSRNHVAFVGRVSKSGCMRRSTTLAALCLVVVLAGCAGLVSDDGTGSGDQVAPGVAENGTVDAAALSDAHVESLTASGYGHEVNLTMTGTNDGEPVETERRQRTSVAPDAVEYTYQTITSGDTSSRIIVWGNETDAFRSVETPGSDPQFQRTDPVSSEQLSGVALFEPHLTASFELVETDERDGTTLYTLEATERPESDAAFPRDATNIRNYESRLIVDDEGRIHGLSVVADYDIDGEAADYELTFRMTGFDDPGVERPSWVGE